MFFFPAVAFVCPCMCSLVTPTIYAFLVFFFLFSVQLVGLVAHVSLCLSLAVAEAASWYRFPAQRQQADCRVPCASTTLPTAVKSCCYSCCEMEQMRNVCFLSLACCASARVWSGWSAEVEAVQLPAIGLPEIASMWGAIQQGKVCWQNAAANILL